MPGCVGTGAAERSYPTSEVRAAAGRSYPMSREWRLRRQRRAERSYSTFKVRRGGHEEIPLFQSSEPQSMRNVLGSNGDISVWEAA